MATATATQKAKGSTGSTRAQGAAEQAVLAALQATPQASAADLAAAAGLGRSTVSRQLAALERRGAARRTAGEREGALRQPDRWELASTPRKVGRTGAGSGQAAGAGERGTDRLPARALDGLVLAFMRKQGGESEFGPGQVGKAIDKSSGAVANCLVRLARDGKVRQVSERPIRYSLAA